MSTIPDSPPPSSLLYAKIPHEAITSLTSRELRVYCAWRMRSDNKTGRCLCGVDTIANMIDMTKRNVEIGMSSLVDKGWMESRRRGRAKTSERFVMMRTKHTYQVANKNNASSDYDANKNNAQSILSDIIYSDRLRSILNSTSFSGVARESNFWSGKELQRFGRMVKRCLKDGRRDWLLESLENFKCYMELDRMPGSRGLDKRPHLLLDFLLEYEDSLNRANNWRVKNPVRNVVPFKTQQNAL